MLLAGVPLAMAYGASVSTNYEALKVRVVSSRPDTVSGGSALVQLGGQTGLGWRIHLNGRDVSDEFHPDASGVPTALLTGLKVGANALQLRSSGRTSSLRITNHPPAGPIFSGAHQKPFACQTFENGLGRATDSDCAAATVVEDDYKSKQRANEQNLIQIRVAESNAAPGSLSSGFKPYNTADPLPDDVAETLTADGHTVPYIVRREIGTLNRAVYDIQVLHVPGQPLPTPWTLPTPGWNGRLVYIFGGGCGAGYHQGTLGAVGRTEEPLLAEGYAVATSTLNIFGNNCDDRVSAETLSMVKEHFIKAFGVPVHTIGWGGSGGAMQQYLIAQNYPGLLDGIIPVASFPDVVTYARYGADCILLAHALKSASAWTQSQKTAVSGFATWSQCSDWGTSPSYHYLDPRSNCPDTLPGKSIYDPIGNPRGVRCDLISNEINVFGHDDETGQARSPFDNVGVQYGLRALRDGRIDAAHFLELNERVGGFDANGDFVASRSQARESTLRAVYQRGLVLTGGGGLESLPIIDWRPYSDDLGVVDGHHRFLSFATRARLLAANGRADNQVMIVGTRESWFEWKSARDRVPQGLIGQMDHWLDRIAADPTDRPEPQKVVDNKPVDLADGCETLDSRTISEPATYPDGGRCGQLYPAYGNSRIVAGEPISDDVLKCALKPIDPNDYAGRLTDAELQRLRALFPGGVCDYSRPGVGQERTLATWQHF